MITEIPYTDACPHCGAELYSFPNHSDETYWRCGTRTSKCLKVCCRSSGCYKRELAASQAEVEGLKTVKDYWANLWADLSHAAISDNVRLEKRAEKAEAEVERLRAFIANELQNKNSDLRDNLRRAIEVAKDLDILGPYRVGGPFENQEKLERRAELLAELEQLKATLNPTEK